MSLVRCTYEEHGKAVLDIFNEAILTSTVLYEYKPRTEAAIRTWFDEKRQGGFPILGVMSDGVLGGFASIGPFRTKPAYKYTVEHSVYVEKGHRGKGLGRLLLRAIVEETQALGYHNMIGAVDAENATSIHLHVTEGFAMAGRIHHAGFKFGRWLDAVFYQKLLPTPEHPVDG